MDKETIAPRPGVEGQFYKTVSYKSSWSELWRDARSPLVLIVWATKLFRVAVPGILNDPPVASLAPFRTDFAAIPPQAVAHLEEMAAALTDEFISEPLQWYLIEDVVNRCRSYICILAGRDNKSVAKLTARLTAARTWKNPRKIVELISPLDDGTLLCTTNSPCYQDAPPAVRLNPAVREKEAKAAESHQRALSGITVTPLPNAASMVDVVERYHAETIEDGRRRGLYRALTATESATTAHLAQFGAQAQVADAADRAVLIEIERLQLKRSNLFGGALTLLITIALFALTMHIGFGEPMMIGIVIVVLFVHELGHFVTMQAFGYRNVQMFFIPFFGAAVKGQHYNVPGWKKAIVALMGPLPGIVIGSVLGVAGLVLHNTILTQIALISLLLNGSNLLPILPFDGGRIAYALLFTRHWLLDAAFRVVASLALVWIGFRLHDRILTPLGVLLLLNLPAAYRTARASAAIRKTVLPTVSADAQTIPTPVAEAIIHWLRSHYPRPVANTIMARRVLDVYETLNARPPGWLATLGLGSVQIVAFLMAAVIGIAVAIGNNPQLARFFQRGLQSPATPMDVNDIASVGTIAARAPATQSSGSREQPIVIANFSSASAARSTYETLKAQIQDGEALELFGRSLMAQVPASDNAARPRWVAAFSESSGDVFVRAGLSIGPIRFRVVTHSNETATELSNEINDYLQLSGSYDLIAPWDRGSMTSEQWAGIRRSRRTLARLNQGQSSENSDGNKAELKALNEKMAEARRLADDEMLKQLQSEQRQLFKKQRIAALNAIANDPAADQQMARTFVAKHASSNFEEAEEEDERATTKPSAIDNLSKYWEQQHQQYVDFAPLLGLRPNAAERDLSMPNNDPNKIAGSANCDGPTVEIFIWTMPDLLTNLPVAARWLSKQDCRQLSYFLGTGKRSAFSGRD